jgi:hypothetical protein
MRETEALLKLVVSILTAIILFPLTLVVGVLRIIKSILSIIEKTILAFIKNVRQELIK